MAHLLRPPQIGQLAQAKRMLIAAMCQYPAVAGGAGDWHLIPPLGSGRLPERP